MKLLLATLALSAALAAPAFAQTATAPQAAASAAAGTDPIVQRRTEERAVNSKFVDGLLAAHKERSAKVDAAVEAALKQPDVEGKDPLVVKRDAEAKANKATKADYDAKVNALRAERKTAMAAIQKKYKTAK